MTGEEKIAEALIMVDDTKQKIQSKYNKVMEKIIFYQHEIQRISSESSHHSQEWINNKIKSLQTKIEELTINVQKWMNDQLENVENWLNNIKEEIKNFIEQLSNSLVLAITGI